jgi:integrase
MDEWLGASRPLARAPDQDAGWGAVLRDRRSDPWPTLDRLGGPRPIPPARERGGPTPAVRAHQLRHAHAVEMAREGVPLNVIQRQLGRADLGVTSVYPQGTEDAEVINAVHARRAPMMSASAGLRL